MVTLHALIDASRRPMGAYESAHVSKTRWVVLLVLAPFIPCGFLLVLWWLSSTGPRVSRQAQIGRIGFPGR